MFDEQRAWCRVSAGAGWTLAACGEDQRPPSFSTTIPSGHRAAAQRTLDHGDLAARDVTLRRLPAVTRYRLPMRTWNLRQFDDAEDFAADAGGRALWSVITPRDVDTMAMPRPFITRGILPLPR